MSKPHVGDHISVLRDFIVDDAYSHHGIYVGKGKVIHYDNDLGFLGKITHLDDPKVRETSLEEFLKGRDEYYVHLYDNHGKETKVIKKRYSD